MILLAEYSEGHFESMITLWQPFFTTMAGVSATLVGLLFVSLSINREKITSGSNDALLRLAKRSFGDFLLVLLIAIFFLIPIQRTSDLAYELFGLGILRAWTLLRRFLEFRKDERRPKFIDLLREYMLPIFTTVGLLIAGIKIYQNDILGVYYFVVPVIATLITRASWNAWLLLIMEKSK